MNPETPLGGPGQFSQAGTFSLRRWLMAGILVLAVAVGVVAMVFWRDDLPVWQNSLQAKMRELPVTVQPHGFEDAIPLFSQKRVIKNYDKEDSKYIQGARTFVTGLPIDTAYAAYISFFGKNGWKIAQPENGNTKFSKTFYANKGSDHASVYVYLQNRETIVSLNVFDKKQ